MNISVRILFSKRFSWSVFSRIHFSHSTYLLVFTNGKTDLSVFFTRSQSGGYKHVPFIIEKSFFTRYHSS